MKINPNQQNDIKNQQKFHEYFIMCIFIFSKRIGEFNNIILPGLYFFDVINLNPYSIIKYNYVALRGDFSMISKSFYSV